MARIRGSPSPDIPSSPPRPSPPPPRMSLSGSPIVADDGGEEEEDEDVDFNPFLREGAYSEASSGLSSENEGPDDATHPPDENAAQTDEISGDVNGLEAADELVKSQNEEDLICRRTRARHSLADYSLEELETFLQESEDEDNLYNVDDESEYRKFLSAVLVGGDDEGKGGEEDEDSDEDFRIEIEELLVSDVDERLEERRVDGRRPVTRQKKRVKEVTGGKNHLPGRICMPLPARPILPYVTNAQSTCLPPPGWQLPISQSSGRRIVAPSGASGVNVFTDSQISQLYCLMHEHTQLLIQVYSVCVLDPSKQQVAVEVQKLIGEMADKREHALTLGRESYPGACFHPRNLLSSVHSNSPESDRCPFWTPITDKPVHSILDVAPLALAKSYLTDICATVLRYRQRQLEGVGERHLEKVPLFPQPTVASSNESAGNAVHGGSTTMSRAAVQPQSPGQQHKKSLAATIVESTKMGSIVLVQKDIAKSALKFYPLFNPTLFPPQPPLPAVVNRVLFTDAEDGLLAMGIMEYNNDWSAIRQRFLPCKTQHQIFVRQKNRSSSKAPENPIKDVRRMKSSPLTANEMAHIYEGLKLFRDDWSLVWKYCVPHRDPFLLPRQWRMASGTQKSYKQSKHFKEKRRVYEAKRRRLKASTTDSETLPGKEVGDEENLAGDLDDEAEAYVHEAFLADTEPRSSNPISSGVPPTSTNRSHVQVTNMMPNRGTDFSRNCLPVTSELRESQNQGGGMHDVATSSKALMRGLTPAYNSSYLKHTLSLRAPSQQLSSESNSETPTICLGTRSFPMRKNNGSRVIKLAPGLPPLNLPRSVRVISQPASCLYKIADNVIKANHSGLPLVSSEGTTTGKSSHENGIPANDPQGNRTRDERYAADRPMPEENASESDFHMHPLLFQDAEGQSSTYYSTNCSASATYNFFPELPLQADNLLGHQSSVRTHNGKTQGPKEPPFNLITLDFHPLLQRPENYSGNYASMQSAGCSSGESEARRGNCELNTSYRASRENLVGHRELVTPTHHEKDKLDLEISLCSLPEKVKSTGFIALNTHSSVEENASTLQHDFVQESLRGDNQYINNKDKCQENLVATNSSIWSKGSARTNMFSFEVVPPSNAGTCRYTEDTHGVSAPEIVMEQEELSDSEDEIQHVEFEHEEMDDSEGESFDGEQISGSQTKDLLSLAATEPEVGHIQDLNQMPHSSSPTQESFKGKNAMSPTGPVAQDSCHAKLSRLKSESEVVKRARSCRSSLNLSRPRPKKPRKQSLPK